MVRIFHALVGLTSHTVVRGSAVVMVGTMAANMLAYLFHLVVGRLLGPVQYGEFTALLSLFYIINVASQVIQTSLAKFFSSLYAKEKLGESKALFIKSTKVLALLCLGGLAVAVALANPVASFLHISSPLYIIWLYIIFSTYIISIVPISALQAFQLFVASSVLVNVGAALRLLFGVVGAFFNVGWVLVSNVASNFITYLLYFIPLRFLLRKRSEPLSLTKRGMLSYSMPTLVATLGTTALYSQDVLLVKHFFSPTDAGIYASLSVLGKVIFYTSAAMGFVLFPVVAQRKERQQDHRRIVLMSLVLVGVVSAMLLTVYFLFPDTVVHLLYGKAFEGAIPYVGWFGVFISLFTLASLLINVNLAAGRTGVWVFPAAAAVLQGMLIWLEHESIMSVIWINTSVVTVLFVGLLLYYAHAKNVS